MLTTASSPLPDWCAPSRGVSTPLQNSTSRNSRTSRRSPSCASNVPSTFSSTQTDPRFWLSDNSFSNSSLHHSTPDFNQTCDQQIVHLCHKFRIPLPERSETFGHLSLTQAHFEKQTTTKRKPKMVCWFVLTTVSETLRSLVRA